MNPKIDERQPDGLVSAINRIAAALETIAANCDVRKTIRAYEAQRKRQQRAVKCPGQTQIERREEGTEKASPQTPYKEKAQEAQERRSFNTQDNSQVITACAGAGVRATCAGAGVRATCEGACEAKAPRPKAFVPPSVEEVDAYCRERRNSVDAEQFIDFYAAKGWMIGKNKMKDWRAAVRTWECRHSGAATAAATVRKADNWRGTRPEEVGDVLG